MAGELLHGVPCFLKRKDTVMVWFKEKGHSHGVVKVIESSHGVVFMPIKLSLNLKVLLKWLIILIFYSSVYS